MQLKTNTYDFRDIQETIILEKENVRRNVTIFNDIYQSPIQNIYMNNESFTQANRAYISYNNVKMTPLGCKQPPTTLFQFLVPTYTIKEMGG